MGNIKGISGLLWFLMIAFLTPVAIKQYGIMGLLIISVLALLNIFSDIFKYKMNFVNEKRIVNFLSRCARFLRKLKKVTFRR